MLPRLNFLGMPAEHTLLPYQEAAAEWLWPLKRGLVQSPAGSGKTIIAASALSRYVLSKPGGRACLPEPFIRPVRIGWIANTNEQCDQARAAIAMFPGMARQIELTVCCPAGAPKVWEFDVLIVDECFPSGTLIDGRRIEEFQAGDTVRAYDHAREVVTQSRVVRLFKSRPQQMVRVHLADGRVISCTAGHPFWDGWYYTPAIQLTTGSMVLAIDHNENLFSMRDQGAQYRPRETQVLPGVQGEASGEPTNKSGGGMPWVREASPLRQHEHSELSEVGRSAQRRGLLLRSVSGSEIVENSGDHDGRDESNVRERAHEGEESHASAGSSGAGINETSSNAVGADNSRWERPWTYDSGDAAFVRPRLADQCYCSDGQTGRVPDPLQDRRGTTSIEGGNRDRRAESFIEGSAGSGPKEGGAASFVRVDRVEVLQPTSDGTFRGVCADGFVYNLEVEGFHNYFAAGVLVHNCHHAPAATWLALVKAHAGCLWMFTATPFGEDAERNAVMRELCDNQIHTVQREEVKARVVPAHVYLLNDTDGGLQEPIDAKIKSDIEKRRRFGNRSGNPETMDEVYRQVASHVCLWMGVCENKARNSAIVRTALAHREDSTLILVPKIDHGEALSHEIPGSAMCFSKMGKKRRREAIEAARAGELRCMIATSLADEGLDVPIFNVLVMAGAGRSTSKVEQRTGRVLRTHGDKTHGTIYDFADHQHPLLENQAKARLRVYRSLNYTVHPERSAFAGAERELIGV